SATTVIQPGITQAIAIGPTHGMENVARVDRQSTDYSKDKIVGVPWDKALQPLFDARCVSCHNGVPGPANPSYTLTDPCSGQAATWTFNLKGDAVSLQVGDFMMDGYSASYLTLAGPDMEAIDKANITVTGNLTIYIRPLDARNSPLMQKLNPIVQYPATDA